MDKRDLPWVVLIAVSFIFGLAASWERWGNPLVDCGREMNQPLRLATGQMLYSNVRHIYGPLSPYLNAWLYGLFGPSLDVLYVNGILSAAIILSLVYWISRQLMGRAASAASTLGVMWLCAFKQAGNYVLPYSYSALHGTALGLASLAFTILYVRRCGAPRSAEYYQSRRAARMRFDPTVSLAAAGVMAALATLAKTEMGVPAIVAGVVAISFPNLRSPRRTVVPALAFLLPAAGLVAAVYATIAARVGWHVLLSESFLLLRNIPPELVYFNKRMSGFDQPFQSIGLMIGATIKVVSLGAIVAIVSLLVTGRQRAGRAADVTLADLQTDAGRATPSQLWMLLGISVLMFAAIPLVGPLGWDKGPYLAMPFFLMGFLIVSGLRHIRRSRQCLKLDRKSLLSIVVAVYALVSLVRVLLRVRSGGAYASYLLPAAVIMFTYGWVSPFADLFRDFRARRLARNLIIGIMLADAFATAGILAYRYRTRNTHPLATAHGTMTTVPDMGQAVSEALAFIEREVPAGKPIAVLPEGTSINFFSGRPNPLREEIVTPGFLDLEGEERAIAQLIDSDTQVVMVTNRETSEFGPSTFGQDYNNALMKWVDEHFEQVAIFGPDKNPDLQIGDKVFFIRAYKKRS